MGRDPKNAEPANLYFFDCAVAKHPSIFTYEQIMEMQERRRVELGR